LVLGFQTREMRFALREVAMLALAAVASFVLINHEVLYLTGPFRLSAMPIESYLLATMILYLFLRLVIVAAEMRPARVREEFVRCPTCGEWLDDPTDSGLEAHLRTERRSTPSEREIVPAVALRKAFDAARLAAVAAREAERSEGPPTPSMPLDDASSEDLVAAIVDPARRERLRHGPHLRQDPREER